MSSENREWRDRLGTIRVHLTLWGAGITFAVCLLVCAGMYLGVRYSLHREVDSFLEGETREFLGVVREHGFNYDDAQRRIRLHLGSRTRLDLTFRIVDEHGAPVLTSHEQDLIPREYTYPGCPERPLTTTRFETLKVPDRRYPVRVCSVPFVGPEDRELVAQASYAMDQVGASLSMLRIVSAAALVSAVMLSLLGGRMLARRSLKPLHEMIGTARRISEYKLSERLPRSHNRDELDQLAETLNGMLNRVQQYVNRMQQFTADASHELRSPLAALQGAGEVALSRDRSAEELRQVIESSLEHYQRLRRITEDLLLLARIDSGEQVFSRDPVRIDSAIEDVVDLFTPLATDRGIKLLFEDRMPLTVTGDAGRLRQLLANLIDNAVKYTTGPGSVRVSVSASDGCARIRLCDTGVGIPPKDLPHVFDRFYRIDRARSKSRAVGAGLGLAICRTIVEGHLGRISLDPGPDGGTVATVDLPLSDHQEMRLREAPAAEPGDA